MTAIETLNVHWLTVEFSHSDEPRDPREWDNVGKMICFHKNYVLGDKHDIDDSLFEDFEEMKQYIIKELGAVVILPLRLHDHSWLSMDIWSARDWDCWQVGFIYATQKEADKEFDWDLTLLEERLRSEVDQFDKYLRGEVYEYTILDDNWNIVDSCTWFTDYDWMKDEAVSMAEAEYKQRTKQKIDKRKQQIKSKVPLEYRKPVSV